MTVRRECFFGQRRSVADWNAGASLAAAVLLAGGGQACMQAASLSKVEGAAIRSHSPVAVL